MRLQTLARTTLTVLLLAALVVIVGCFESKYPLGARTAGAVDLRYVGDWLLESTDEHGQVETTRLIVRNLHNDEYYAEWITDDGTALRSTAYLTDINGVTFANILPLTDSGAIAEKYTIMRVDFDAGKIKLQNLSEEFFKNKSFDSSDALRSIVKDNLDNAEMYAGEPLFGTKEQK